MRRLRLLFALALLALSAAACRADVEVTARVHDDGSGTFRIAFAFDKEFLSVVASSEDGRESLAQLRAIGEQFGGSGWRVRRTEPAGGLRIEVERDFDDPAALHAALADASAQGAGPFSFLEAFGDLRVSVRRGLFRSNSALEGSVDLSTKRLAPGVELKPEIEAAFRQAARESFRFAITAELPGEIRRFQGDPERVAGGTIVWNAPLGETLAFSAQGSGLRVQGLAMVGAPALALAGWGIAVGLRRRRRRAEAVPGWDPAPAGVVADTD